MKNQNKKEPTLEVVTLDCKTVLFAVTNPAVTQDKDGNDLCAVAFPLTEIEPLVNDLLDRCTRAGIIAIPYGSIMRAAILQAQFELGIESDGRYQGVIDHAEQIIRLRMTEPTQAVIDHAEQIMYGRWKVPERQPVEAEPLMEGGTDAEFGGEKY